MTETKRVMLRIRTEQRVPGEDPEIMELQSEGTLAQYDDRTELTYVESAVTGLEGVTTTFVLYDDRVVLIRDGEKLKNTMVFQVGKKTDSLYDVGFGALLITVTAQRTEMDLVIGKFSVEYTVEVEHTYMGTNTYAVSYRVLD
ncbi:MAG: DUF1934 domain-containing protein [Oscillospiraceae bacterium]|nr:DUF1934 domain-containing protein [Oscillospiraceae bacterium]